jgi:hypothetical protein
MADDIEHAEWEPHTCAHPPEVDTCAGCKQREDMHLQPVSQRLRDEQRAAELRNAPPLFAAIWLQGTWLACCNDCGALVVSQATHPEVRVLAIASKEAHTRWHRRMNDLAHRLGVEL